MTSFIKPMSIAVMIAAWIVAACIPATTSAPSAQTGDAAMIEGLKMHHSQTCGPLDINTFFTPVTDIAHLRDIGVADPYEHRIAFEIYNRDGPDGLKFKLQAPAPLAFFFKIGKQQSNGSYRDITAAQIDPIHTGKPEPQEITFPGKQDRYYSQISYAAFRTIAAPTDLIAGRYRVTVDPYAIVSVGGQECLSDIPSMEIEVRK